MIDTIKNSLREIKDILEMDNEEYYERFIVNSELAQDIDKSSRSIYACKCGVVEAKIQFLLQDIEFYQKW